MSEEVKESQKFWLGTDQPVAIGPYENIVVSGQEIDPGTISPTFTTPHSPTITSLLHEAARCVDGQREQQHGDKYLSFKGIAAMWNAYLENRKDKTAPLTGSDVAWMMALLKQQRAQWGAPLRDHFLDAAGYVGIAWKLADMDRQQP